MLFKATKGILVRFRAFALLNATNQSVCDIEIFIDFDNHVDIGRALLDDENRSIGILRQKLVYKIECGRLGGRRFYRVH